MGNALPSPGLRLAAVLLFLLAPLALSPAQGLTVRPGVVFPLGDAASWAGLAKGIDAAVYYDLPGTQWRFTGTLGATLVPFTIPGSLTVFTACPGVEFWFPLTSEGWTLGLAAQAGGAWGVRSSFSQGLAAPYLALGTTLRVRLAPTLQFVTEAQFEAVPGLWQGIGIWAGFDQALGGP